jgi:sec-independent protein translocase protein TatA
MDLGPGELAIILVIILVLFGGKKLPELARSLGQAKKEFEAGGTSSEGATSAQKDAPAVADAGRAVVDDGPASTDTGAGAPGDGSDRGSAPRPSAR